MRASSPVCIFIASIQLVFESDPTITVEVPPDYELALAIIFSMEVILRFLAHGRTTHTYTNKRTGARHSYAIPSLRYFNDHWNKLDFVVATLSWVPAGGVFKIFRSLRLLRLLKLAKSFPKLRITLQSFFNSLISTTYILALMFLIIFLYAVIGESCYQWW
jgi:hypothetical protein